MALWIPRSVDELESAVESELVSDSHHLDFKAFTQAGKIPDTAAKCTASLAVDGGVLIIGVGEDKKARRFLLEPKPLVGVRDALDSMIANRVTPSLGVTVDELKRADGTGYLVVLVPASARAPHMVGGRYFSRTDTAAHQSSDDEVRRLWLRHVDRRSDRDSILKAEVAREPVPLELRRGARLFVVAQPVSADPRLLLDVCEGRDLRRWLMRATNLPVFSQQRTYAPHMGATQEVHRRSRGVARSSHHLESDRTVVGDLLSPEDCVDLEIWEDGGIRLYYERASGVLRKVDYLLLSGITGEVSGVIELAREISTLASFRGSWSFGVALRGLKSLPAHSTAISGEQFWKYSDDSYDETPEVDNATLFDVGSLNPPGFGRGSGYWIPTSWSGCCAA
jgi:hypothetical protein